jgi:hypothetical protein
MHHCSFIVQLDCMPYKVLAGSSSYRNCSSKDIHRFNVAGIISWMSIFSSTHIKGILEKDMHAANIFLQTLNHHLADHAFLVGSSNPTFAEDSSSRYHALNLTRRTYISNKRSIISWDRPRTCRRNDKGP